MFFLHLRQKNFNPASMPPALIEIKKVKKNENRYKLEMEGVQLKDIRSYRVWGTNELEVKFLQDVGLYDECKGEMTCLYMYPKEGETKTTPIIIAESMAAFSNRIEAIKVLAFKD